MSDISIEVWDATGNKRQTVEVPELSNDLLESLTCTTCNETQSFLSSLGKVKESIGRCPSCGEHRTPNMYHTISDNPGLLDKTLEELGIPAWDVLAGRAGIEQKFYEFDGDQEAVLGDLADEVLMLS
jgi:hypothetical protein